MGIVNNEMQAQPPAEPATQPVSDPGIQDAVHRVVAAGSKILYNAEIAKHIVAMISSDQSPAAGLAHASMFLLMQLTKLSKNTMPAAAKIPALKELSILIAELAQHAGVIQGDVKPVIIEARNIIAQGMELAYKTKPDPSIKPSAPVQPFIQR